MYLLVALSVCSGRALPLTLVLSVVRDSAPAVKATVSSSLPRELTVVNLYVREPPPEKFCAS